MGVAVRSFDPRGFFLFSPKKRLRAGCYCKKRAIRRSVLCGLMLFALGLISLSTGQIAADLELSRLRGLWRSKRVLSRHFTLQVSTPDPQVLTLHFQGLNEPIDIWKSNYSNLYCGCSARGPHSIGHNEPIDIWKSKYSDLYYGCSDRGPHFRSAVRESKSNGYLLIATSGGLNQQRTGITDAVVVARILNATLVVPELDHYSFWKDDSDFANIFDVDWFISSLSKDVTIVRRIPDKVMRSMEKPPYTMRPPRKSTPEYYLYQVLPILLRRRAVQLTKFDYRLANRLDDELQKLRCRVNYHALRFTRPIQILGQSLVKRMRKMSSRFIAVHLRFEPDMLAFSGCYYGGGEKERHELGEIRKRWAKLPDLSAVDERSRGKCPLTPHEVGLMLRALGFENDTYMFIASGDIYGGEQTLQPLKDLFPNLYTKEMLAGDDLKPFLPFSSRLAAIDYIVCDETDVFATNNNGNMARMLAGRRRYMGHKRTIRPNARKLSSLFKARKQMDWVTFARKVKACERGFLGEPDEMRLGRFEFHEFPWSCICQKPGDPFGEDLKKPTKQLFGRLHQVPELDYSEG